jgi:WD40 repeat protein
MPAYDAFVSYSHADDADVVRPLQSGVERFAKPWYRTRALRLFVDTASLAADPRLWSSIEGALADSSWFVLLASPGTAASPWVDREIRWWLEHRTADRLLIVLTRGTLEWDGRAGRFDAEASTALPPALAGAFDEEPHWVHLPEQAAGGPDAEDARLREAVVDVATAIREVPKEELAGAAAREHRRTMRWVRGAIAALSALLVAAIAAGIVALAQRGEAIDQAEAALSRQVASVSQAAAGTDLDVAMLLAVQAYRRDANPQTRAALFAASTSSPHLVRFLDAGSKVEKLAGSADRETVAVGLADGRVLRWTKGADGFRLLFSLSRRISSLAISDDGEAIAAADRAQAMLWRGGRRPVALAVPVGQHADVVGVSPSGDTVAYHGAAPHSGGPESVTVALVSDPARRSVHRVGEKQLGYFSSLVLPSDRELLLFNGGGPWEWRRIADWARLGAAKGAHQFGGGAVSADGRFFTATNRSTEVPVWRTAGETDLGQSDLSVRVTVSDQSALALSPDGSKLAVAGSGTIYVAPTAGLERTAAEGVAEPEDLSERPVELTGQGTIAAGLLSFAGDDSHLVSASGSEVAIWDLNQLDRLARRTTVPLEYACTACGPATLAVSPDGERLAAVDGYQRAGFVASLDGAGLRPFPEQESYEYAYGTPVWEREGEFVALPVWAAAGGSNPPVPDGLSDEVRAWRAGRGESSGLGAVLGADGDTVILVDGRGGVYWQDAESGDLRDNSPGPEILAESEEALEGAALNSSPELVAMVDEGAVTVESLPSRNDLARIEAGEFASVAFAGGHLLVQRKDGRLEVWNERGTRLQRTLDGDESFSSESVGAPVGSPSGAMVARRRTNGTFVLDDLDTGGRLASFSTAANSVFARTGVAFSPDAEVLVALTEMPFDTGKGELVLRDISDAALIAAACKAAGRDLSADEWRAFVGTSPPGDRGCE